MVRSGDFLLARGIDDAPHDGNHVGVDMSREDVEIHGASVWSPEEFDISFYQSGDHPVASGSLDKMVGDLKDAVEEVPGVTLSEAE